MVAVETGNHINVGKLIYCGASCIDEALEKSRILQHHLVTGTLLIVKAAMVDDWVLVMTLYGENVHGLATKISIAVGDNLSELQNCVLDRSFKTGIAIEISQRNNALKVSEQLLLRTGINKEEGTVLWLGLHLKQLDICWLQKVDWVKELILARNELSFLPTEIGTNLKNCTKIDLQQNKLRKIPYSLLEAPCLAILNLSNNLIVEIPNVKELPASLSVLKLSHNHLRNLPNFVSSKLETLDISFNEFIFVPDCVCSFSALTTLNISFNSAILMLPNQLGQLKSLHDLNLEGLVNLNHPPRSSRASTADCIRFLNSQLLSGNFHMKLMVLGKHGVGKSTIVARLQSKQISSRSCSIAISKWKYSPQSSGKKSFNFRIWDFIHREKYDVTYQCFLSKRSMYLLLWNVSEGETGVSSLKPFLDSISTLVPGSCVIIVGTFADMLADEQLPKRVDYLMGKVEELTSQYQALLVASINVVNLQDETEDLVKLRDDIYNAASEYKLNNQYVIGAMIPSCYHVLDKKLSSIYQKFKEKNVMYAAEFRKLIKGSNLTDIRDDDYEEIYNASQFLHEVGTLLFYADHKNCLDDLYIINPSWLYDIVSKVVSVELNKQCVIQGILTIKDLVPIAKDTGFPLKYILTLLSRFKIIFPLDEKFNWILIPPLLPKTGPDIILNDKHYFRRLILFPSSLLSDLTFSWLWSQLLSNITISVKEVMDLMNEQMPIDKDDIISASNSSISKALSFNSISDKLSDSDFDDFRSLHSETVSSLTNEESKERDGLRIGLPLTLGAEPSNSQQLDDYKSSNKVNIRNLWYWHRGLLYSTNRQCFVISSVMDNSKHNDQHGIQIMCSSTVEGCKVFYQLIELVKQLISTHYPVLLFNLEQKVPCPVCITVRVQYPFEFHVDQLLLMLDSNKVTTQCGAFHKVHLKDLVPTNLDPVHLLDTNNLMKNYLICTISFTGKSSISNGAFVSLNEAGLVTVNELWICCDGVKGTELHIFQANTLERINRVFLKEVQVCFLKQCVKFIWVAAQVDLGDGILFIFDIQSQELLFEISTENIVVSCIANSDHTVYIGTEDGFCFAIPLDEQFKCIDIWSNIHNKVSEYCIDGLVLADTHLWLSSYNELHILNSTNLVKEYSEETAKRHTHVGKAILSYINNQVWAAHLGGVTVSCWNAFKWTYLRGFDVGVVSSHRCHINDSRDQIITAMSTSLDTVWIGLASGHIIAFDMNSVDEVVTYYKPYHSPVCFLSSIANHQNGECIMLSGGKVCEPDYLVRCVYVYENNQTMDTAGFAILWSFKKPSVTL